MSESKQLFIQFKFSKIMAGLTQTFYCCKYSTEPFSDLIAGGCSGSWTVEVNSASSPNTFGSYTNAFILSRTCAKMSSPPCFGGTVSGEVIMGCVPQSLYPITVNLTVKRGSNIVTTLNKVINTGTDCLNCESRCGVLS